MIHFLPLHPLAPWAGGLHVIKAQKNGVLVCVIAVALNGTVGAINAKSKFQVIPYFCGHPARLCACETVACARVLAEPAQDGSVPGQAAISAEIGNRGWHVAVKGVAVHFYAPHLPWLQVWACTEHEARRTETTR